MATFSRKRPWLAVLLGLLFTGLGHVYLRRWRRAFGWYVLTIAVSLLSVPPGAFEALLAGEADIMSFLPVLAVSIFSVFDVYRLALIHNARLTASPASGTDEPEPDACPECGRPVDGDLDFCHWCSTQLSNTSE
ncbi:MAG: DUF7575 domain-containing protein [Halobacteriota archaeon]